MLNNKIFNYAMCYFIFCIVICMVICIVYSLLCSVSELDTQKS